MLQISVPIGEDSVMRRMGNFKGSIGGLSFESNIETKFAVGFGF